MIVKSAIRRAASVFGLHSTRFGHGGLVVLAYHRVFALGDPRIALEQPMMWVSCETLDLNLRWAAEYFSFIKLTDWMNHRGSMNPHKRYCAVTFDDGWIDTYTNALPVLSRHSAPATIFCVPGAIERGGDFWPGLIARVLCTVDSASDSDATQVREILSAKHGVPDTLITWTTLSSSAISKVIEHLKGRFSDRQIYEIAADCMRALSIDLKCDNQIMTASQVSDVARSDSFDIGCHTATHRRLSLSDSKEVLFAEVVASKIQLEGITGKPVQTFCYPNGFHPKNAEDLVRNHYLCGLTLDRGWNWNQSDPAVLKRVSLHEQIARTRHGFLSCVSGLL